MTKKSKKFFLLIVLVILAVTGLALGGTFATEETLTLTGEKNQLEDGKNFNVSAEFIHSNNGDAGYTDLLNAPAFHDAAKWCPGRTEIIYLRLTNEEAFPVSATVQMHVTETGFDDVLSYAVIEEDLLANNKAAHPTSWDAYAQKAGNENVHVLAKATHTLMDKVTLIPDQPRYLALAIHMDESATSRYEKKDLNMHFSLRYDANYAPGETPGPG